MVSSLAYSSFLRERRQYVPSKLRLTFAAFYGLMFGTTTARITNQTHCTFILLTRRNLQRTSNCFTQDTAYFVLYRYVLKIKWNWIKIFSTVFFFFWKFNLYFAIVFEGLKFFKARLLIFAWHSPTNISNRSSHFRDNRNFLFWVLLQWSIF